MFDVNTYINNIKPQMIQRGFLNDDLEMLRQVWFKYQELQQIRLANARTKSQYESAIRNLENIPRIDSDTLSQFNFNKYNLDRLKYTYQTALNKISIDNEYQLQTHFRKLNRNFQGKIGIQDLIASTIREVPRKCVIAGIPSDSPFAVYNSSNYKGANKLFNVIHATPTKATIITPIKPVLKYGQAHGISDCINVNGLVPKTNREGKTIDFAEVDVYKRYFRLCNRFIIVASLRQPEYHLGMYVLIANEGSKVYVYAKNMGISASPKYNGSTERVYDYGFFNGEISNKLKTSAIKIYRKLQCVSQQYLPATMTFVTVEPDRKVDENGYDVEEDD